jgi:hypothetical protein
MRRTAVREEETALPETRMTSGRRLETALFFLFVFTVYVVSPIVTSGDSRFVVPTALSVLRHGDADIDEYSHQFNEAPWVFRTENGHHWNVYPIGVPLLSLPFVWALDGIKRLAGFDLHAEAL